MVDEQTTNSKAKQVSKKQIEFINHNLERICNGETVITAHPISVSFHLVEVINHQLGEETRIFNILTLLGFLPNLSDGINALDLWNLLLSTDPRAPEKSNHYNVTFIDENNPYLEWRWVGEQFVEKRYAFYNTEHIPLLGWERLKSAELYHQYKNKAPLWEWLEPLGFYLPGDIIQKWDNFTSGEEILLFSTTGPSIVTKGDQLEVPEKGWCKITRVERVPSSSDQDPESELEEVTSKWEEFLYFGYVIEP